MARRCDKCGAMIPDGSEYCPSCGDGYVEPRTVYAGSRNRYSKREDNLGIVPNLMLVYGALALIGGLVLLAMGMSASSLPGVEQGSSGTTAEETRQILIWWGWPLFVSGICAAVSAILARNRTKHRICFGLCVAAAIVPMLMGIPHISGLAFGIILLVIGALMAHRIMTNVDSFSS